MRDTGTATQRDDGGAPGLQENDDTTMTTSRIASSRAYAPPPRWNGARTPSDHTPLNNPPRRESFFSNPPSPCARPPKVAGHVRAGGLKDGQLRDGGLVVQQRAQARNCPQLNSIRATSLSRVFSPVGAWVLTMMLPELLPGSSNPPSFCALICNSKSTVWLTGCWPIAPAATCTFCSRMALTTSLAVRLREAILSGLSQMRMA